MNSTLFRLRVNCVAFLGMAVFASNSLAQPFNYRVEFVDFHAGNNGSQGTPSDIAMVNDGSGESLVIVGKSTLVTGQARAFAYLRKTNEFVDVPTFLSLDENAWIGSSCTAVSANGIVVGVVYDVGGIGHSFWFDLLSPNPTLNLLADVFPQIVEGGYDAAIDVNANGEILTGTGWVVNINTQISVQLPEVMNSVAAINEFGVVIGWDGSGCFRYNIHNGALESIVAIDSGVPNDINNFGKFCGFANVPYVYRKNQIRTRVQAYRWGSSNAYDWLSDPALPTGLTESVFADSLNDSGDVVGSVSEYHPNEVFFYNAFLLLSESDINGSEAGTTYLIKDLVNDAYLGTASLGGMLVTERDPSLSTPAPIVVGNAETESDEKIFILIPEEVPPSITYASTDTPIAIPDYNPANPQGINSTISVPDDVTITGLTVTLNITHQRPADLVVWLYGPDNGPPVQLSNLSGGNNVTDFNGTSSLGDWTLEVYDTVKKKTGTLNGWSITIEH